MTLPRLGYLALGDNPSDEAGRALVRQFVLVREADRMGYDDIWVGEHPLDAAWPQPAIGVLLGHLAAVTSKARIGAFALVPGRRPLAPLAEDLASVDLLSRGRLDLVLASGVCHAAALGLAPSVLRSALHDTLRGLPPALAAAVPLPQQRPLPVAVAADDADTLAQAARLGQGLGLAAAATHDLARVLRQRQAWRDAGGAGDAPLTLARFACSADTGDEAVALARPYLEAVLARAAARGWGCAATSVDDLLAQSLVGSHAEVARRFKSLGSEFGVTRVAIVPTSAQFDTHKHILAAFVDEVRPLLEDG